MKPEEFNNPEVLDELRRQLAERRLNPRPKPWFVDPWKRTELKLNWELRAFLIYLVSGPMLVLLAGSGLPTWLWHQIATTYLMILGVWFSFLLWRGRRSLVWRRYLAWRHNGWQILWSGHSAKSAEDAKRRLY